MKEKLQSHNNYICNRPVNYNVSFKKEIKEEEEQVFIATAKGRNGPERPLHPSTCDQMEEKIYR